MTTITIDSVTQTAVFSVQDVAGGAVQWRLDWSASGIVETPGTIGVGSYKMSTVEADLDGAWDPLLAHGFSNPGGGPGGSITHEDCDISSWLGIDSDSVTVYFQILVDVDAVGGGAIYYSNVASVVCTMPSRPGAIASSLTNASALAATPA